MPTVTARTRSGSSRSIERHDPMVRAVASTPARNASTKWLSSASPMNGWVISFLATSAISPASSAYGAASEIPACATSTSCALRRALACSLGLFFGSLAGSLSLRSASRAIHRAAL